MLIRYANGSLQSVSVSPPDARERQPPLLSRDPKPLRLIAEVHQRLLRNSAVDRVAAQLGLTISNEAWGDDLLRIWYRQPKPLVEHMQVHCILGGARSWDAVPQIQAR